MLSVVMDIEIIKMTNKQSYQFHVARARQTVRCLAVAS